MPTRPPRAYQPESLEFAPIFRGNRRRNHISRNSTLACHEIIDFVRLGAHRHKLGNRFAAFGNHHRLVLGLHFVHHRQTLSLEGTCRHRLHARSMYDYSHYTMVIIAKCWGIATRRLPCGRSTGSPSISDSWYWFCTNSVRVHSYFRAAPRVSFERKRKNETACKFAQHSPARRRDYPEHLPWARSTPSHYTTSAATTRRQRASFLITCHSSLVTVFNWLCRD